MVADRSEMPGVARRVAVGRLVVVLLVSVVGPAFGQSGLGLAADYPNDLGLGGDPSVLYVLSFDSEAQTQAWYGTKAGYGWTSDPNHVFAGDGALEIQQIEGTHTPSEIYAALPTTDIAFVRWYRKWQTGYDWTQHKMPGVYAKAPGVGGGGAGIPPTGYDKYSCKLYVDWNRIPRFYTYHPDQAGAYGDGLLPNLVEPSTLALSADQWYCFEMMLKANTIAPDGEPNYDGELKMWVEGELVGHYQGMRFRNVDTLKINEFTYSAYVGGTWVSVQDQNLWDDQIVVATEYIGPLVRVPPVTLIASEPADGGTLAKSQNNVIELKFDGEVLPGGSFSIVELGVGTEVGDFFYVADDPNSHVVYLAEVGSILADRTWYRVTPRGGVNSVPFTLDVCTLVGDADGDGLVQAFDLGVIWAHRNESTYARWDTDGDGVVQAFDLGVAWSRNGSSVPTKPN